MSGIRDPYDDYQAINVELEKYGYNLTKRPTIICGTKMDEDGAEERLLALEKKLKTKIYGISALTHEGLQELMYAGSAGLLVASVSYLLHLFFIITLKKSNRYANR